MIHILTMKKMKIRAALVQLRDAVLAIVFPVMRSHYATTRELFNHVLSLLKLSAYLIVFP